MKGIALQTLNSSLHAVSEANNAKPSNEVPDLICRLRRWRSASEYGELIDQKLREEYHRFPLDAFAAFSFDELCKLKYSTIMMMSRSVDELFGNPKEDADFAEHEVVRKVENSMWRYSFAGDNWNEVVEAHTAIRNFSLDFGSEFEIRLDYTTGCNQFGYSQFSRTFLDGVFGFLVHHKGVHVMTIGFSVLADRKILLQQVQLKERLGNRWLYKLSKPRLELVVGAFLQSFPKHKVYLVDGRSLHSKTIGDYRDALHRTEEKRRRSPHDKDYVEECRLLNECLSHLSESKERITRFYADAGRFHLGEMLESIAGLRYYKIENNVAIAA